jgi:hypothetical protein
VEGGCRIGAPTRTENGRSVVAGRGILDGMKTHCEPLQRWLILATLVSLVPMAFAVPIGYRYIGSRLVAEGRAVFWYWNVDQVEIGAYDVSFVARMYARAVDVNQERPYVAVVRCDSRTYREFESQGPYVAIDDGSPIHAVWRAGCDAGKAVSLAARHARLNASAALTGSETVPRSSAATSTVADSSSKTTIAAATASPTAKALPKAATVAPATAAGSADTNDERRVDRCVRFAEGKVSQFGEATMTNTCTFAIEVAFCYKGGRGGIYDCPSRAKGMRMESLPPGATHSLPEYRRDRHQGISAVACKGTMGTVIPMLNGEDGKTGCH